MGKITYREQQKCGNLTDYCQEEKTGDIMGRLENNLARWVGRTIVECRLMTPDELADEGWENNQDAAIIIFNDGSRIYPSADEDGSKAGVMFGKNKKGEPSYLF